MIPPYVGILSYNQRPVGSAFVVRADGLLVTCYHVLREAAKPDAPAGKRFLFRPLGGDTAIEAVVIDRLLDEAHDLACLQLLGGSELPAATLVRSMGLASGAQFHIAGYGDVSREAQRYEYTSAFGEVVGVLKRDGIELLQLRSPDILRGMSGAPVIVDAAGGVVGVLSWRYSIDPRTETWLRDTAGAACSEDLARLEPGLTLQEAQRQITRPAEVNIRSVNYGQVAAAGAKIVTITEGQYIEGGLNVNYAPITREWKRPRESDPHRRYELPIVRRKALQRVHDELQQHDTVVISGASGTGKSTLAAQYAREYGREELFLGGVLWAELGTDFSSEQSQPILDRWACFAYGGDVQILQIDERGRRFQFQPEAVNALLSGHGAILVVVNDLQNDLTLIDPLRRALPDDAKWLITSNNRDLVASFLVVDLGDLTLDEALALLDLRGVAQSKQRRLIKGLGYSLQAISLAAHDIRRHSVRERPQAVEAWLKRVEARMGPSAQATTSDKPGASAPPSERRATEPPAEARAPQELVGISLEIIYDEIGKTMGAEYQRCFRALGVFSLVEADFSTALAAAVWGLEVSSQAEPFLQDLRDRRILTQTAHDRWSIHTRVRAYTSEVLAQSGEQDEAFARYARTIYDLVLELSNLPIDRWLEFAPDLPHIYAIGQVCVSRASELLGSVDYFDGRWPSIEQFDQEGRDTIAAAFRFVSCNAVYFVNYPEHGSIVVDWLPIGLCAAAMLQEHEDEAGLLYIAGLHFVNSNDTPAALRYLERGLALCERHHVENVRMWILKILGSVYQGLSKLDKATDYYRRALACAAADDLDQRADLHNALGEISIAAANMRQAITELEKGLLLARQVGNQALQIRILQNLGLTYSETGQVKEGMERLRMAEEIMRAIPDLSIRVRLLYTKGCTIVAAGRYEDAIVIFLEALDLARQINAPVLQAEILRKMAWVRYNSGKNEEALRYLREALPKVEGDDEPSLRAQYELRNAMGQLYKANGNTHEALDSYHRALPTALELQDRRMAVVIIDRLGAIYHESSRFQEGVRFFEELLPQIGDTLTLRIATVTWLGLLTLQAGDAGRAWKLFDSLPDQFDTEQIESLAEQATDLWLIGHVTVSRGQIEKGLTIFQQVRNIAQRQGDLVGEAEALFVIAELCVRQAQTRQVEDYLAQIDGILSKISNLSLKVKALSMRGILCLVRQDIEAALQYFEEAYAIAQRTEEPILKILVLNNAAWGRALAKQTQQALDMFQEALRLSRKHNLPTYESMVLGNRGLVYASIACLKESAANFEQAIAVMEHNNIRMDVGGSAPEDLQLLLQMVHDELPSGGAARPIEEVLALFVKTTGWNLAERVVRANERTLLQPGLTAILEREIAEARGDMVEVLRAYKQVLEWCRTKGIDAAFQSAREQYNNHRLYHWWGAVHRSIHELALAFPNLTRAIELAPEEASHYIERGWIYRGLGNRIRALQDFKQAIALEPGNGRAHQGCGVISYEEREYTAGLHYLDEAIRIDAKNPYHYHWRAAVRQELGDYPAALADLDRAIDLDGENTDHAYWRALVLIDQRNYTDALAALDRLCEQDAGNSRRQIYDRIWRGVAHQLTEQPNAALLDWNAAAGLVEQIADTTAQNVSQALLYAVQDQTASARDCYEQALRANCARHILESQTRHLRRLADLLPRQEGLSNLGVWLQERLDGAAPA